MPEPTTYRLVIDRLDATTVEFRCGVQNDEEVRITLPRFIWQRDGSANFIEVTI